MTTTGPTTEGARALAALARDRGAACGLLAAWFRPPGPELAAALACPEVAQPFACAGLEDRARALRELGAGTDWVGLNVEHTRLFGGPRPAAPPYESVYRDPGGAVMGRATAEVVREYGAAGFTHEGGEGELPDHVAAELDFLGLMSQEEGAAWASGDTRGAARSLERQRAFLARHLLLWFPAFAGRAAGAHPHHFYGTLLELTGSFLARCEACVGGLGRFVAEEIAPGVASGGADA